MEEVMENDSIDRFIPPWVGDLYMSKGYKLADIIKVYSNSIFRYFLYPFNNPKQKKGLEIEDGKVVKIISYDMYANEDANEEDMGWEYLGYGDALKKDNLFM